MKIYCNNCGAQIDTSFKFCPACGTAVTQAEETGESKADERLLHDDVNEKKSDVSHERSGEKDAIDSLCDSDDKFYTNLSGGRKVLLASGKAGRMLNNGVKAAELLENEGYSCKPDQIVSHLWPVMDTTGDVEEWEVLSPVQIALLYRMRSFFFVLRCDISWKKASLFFDDRYEGKLIADNYELMFEVTKKILQYIYPNEKYIDSELWKGAGLRTGEYLILSGELDRALEWYEQYVEVNGDESGYNSNIIGGLYYNRFNSSEEVSSSNYIHAVEWFKKSAEKNNTLGIINLVFINSGRWITEKNRKALMEQGVNLKNNNVDALYCLLQAYDQGSEYAKDVVSDFLFENFVELYENGCKIEDISDYDFTILANRCEETAKRGEFDIAQGGNISGECDCAINIGYMYHHGIGRPISVLKAIEYYQKAVDVHQQNISVDVSKLLKDIYTNNSEMIRQKDNVTMAIKRIVDIDNKTRSSDDLKDEQSVLYDIIGTPSIYRNKKAIKFIYEYMTSSRCSPQLAYEAYDRQLLLDRQQAEMERERRRRMEAEQERIRREEEQIQQEERRREMERFNREYDEYERERERAYEEKYGKKDLYGSSVCIKRFQKSIFDIEHSCTFCPQSRNCTRA